MQQYELVYKAGDIVESKAGRDSGRRFVVMWTEDVYVGIADGELHKVDKIKKKKNKHLKFLGSTSKFIAEKTARGEKVTNTEVRRTLAEFDEGGESYGKG